MDPYEDQVALITGASRGIGRHLASHFIERGALVVGVSRSGSPIVDDPRYVHVEADLTDEAQAIAAVRAAWQIRRRLDIAVNNTGAAAMNHALLTPASTAERLMAVNYLTTFAVSREAAKYMQRRSYGRIVNLSSVAVPLRIQGEAAYAAAKSAVETYSRVLAREVAAYGVTCNVVAPGPAETDLTAHVPREKLEAIFGQMAIHRFTTLDEIAYAVEVFTRPGAAALTGQVLYLGGVG